MTAVKVFVRFCAVKEVNTSTENVNAILDGKAKNVNCGMMNVKYLIAMDMGIVLMENAAASGVTRESFVKRLIVHTLHVLVMDIAWKGLAFVRRAGKALIVDKWTKRHYNVYQTVLVMDLMILSLRLVLASRVGQEKTVPKNYVIWTAETMATACPRLVTAIKVGQENFAI